MERNWVDFKAIKTAVPIAAVLQRYGVQGLKKHGPELRGRCPIHAGDGAEAFSVNTQKNAFQCFSCKAKGNVLDFVAAMESCSLRDAGLKLQDWFALTPAAEHQRQTEPGDKSELAREGKDPQPELQNQPLSFQLKGIDHTHPYLTARGIDQQTAEVFGVGFYAGKGSMSGRIVIPIRNGAGELVAYAGRAIEDGAEPRYQLPAGFHKSRELYNLHRAIGAGERGLIVVEGYFDAMKLHQAGYPFVVALMGCTLSTEQERLLVTHADQVLLLLDGDSAGRQATDEILLRLGRKIWTKVVTLPDGKQPDQLDDDAIKDLVSP